MNEHKQKEIDINGNKIEVDEKLANVIVKLNNKGYKTIYSCQGDKYNEGYIKFDESVNMEFAYSVLDSLLPCHVLRLDLHNIIRFAKTKQAYLHYYEMSKKFKSQVRKITKEPILIQIKKS